jgi:hypothetical protein
LPVVFFCSGISGALFNELRNIVQNLGGQITKNETEATHVIDLPANTDWKANNDDVEWLRTLEKKDAKCFIHWYVFCLF